MNTARNYFNERIIILILLFIYLVIFNPELPHGDALRIVDQIKRQALDWNPNHLLLDPTGYYWYFILSDLGLSLEPLTSFELLSAISALISVYIFHLILIQQKITDYKIRILAIVLLLGAKNFLSLAVSQYYFMIQMPFLLGALFSLLKYFEQAESNKDTKNLIISGACLSIATAIEANNIMLIIITGIVMAIRYKNDKSRFSDAIVFYLASAAVGFPLFLIGYYLSGSEISFISWGLTYAGSDSEQFKQLYGLQTSLTGIALSLTKLGYNFVFGNFIETSGLGIGLKALVSDEVLEFNPDYFGIGLGIVAMPLIALLQLIVFISFYRNHNNGKLYLFLLGWIVSYLVFAFLWDNGGNIFWFQTLPVIVLIYAYHAQRTLIVNRVNNALHTILMVSMPIIALALSTIQIAVPSAFFDMERGIKLHNQIIRDGDLEITTGWDKYQWMKEEAVDAEFDRLLLMNMATKDKNDPENISNLPKFIDKHLSEGKRVIVARLYNKDSDSNPWYNLSRMGWPRLKIQQMLSNYCNQEINRIDDVVFHEIYVCK
ncbi:MAG: hypothetical protein ABW101_08710 [Candidatus Thiodiazotropha sp.]